MKLSNDRTIFLNVDLDLRGASGLDELIRYLKPAVVVMNWTTADLSVELNIEGSCSLDETLRRFVTIVQSLPQSARKIWDGCEFRRFNAGIQAGREPHEEHFLISKEVIAAVASIQGELLVTVYAPVADASASSMATIR